MQDGSGAPPSCQGVPVSDHQGPRELSADEQELVELAQATIDAATDAGPDNIGVHTVGAAVRAGDGRTFVGVNLTHFTGGPCAELVALGAARAGGATSITTVVATASHGRGVISPCGRDRQILFDHHRDARVLVPTPHGLRSITVPDLLPHPYHWTPGGSTTTGHDDPAPPA